MNYQLMCRISSGLAALALLLIMGPSSVVAQKSDSKEISRLLVEAKDHAVLAEDDAATLEDFTRSKLSWRTHGSKLTEIKDHVNALGVVSKQLNDLREQGSTWQQKAIEQIDPLLRDMASHLTATINHLNENQSRVHMKPYSDYAEANHEVASRMAELVKDFVEYDKATSKAESLESKLELPAHETTD